MATPDVAGPVRPRFVEGQFLHAADLAVEQSHRIGRRRRHRVGHHTWGILGGLDLTVVGGRVEVAAGAAIDGHGRHLALARPHLLAADVFDRLGPSVDVWLAHDPRPRRTSRGPSGAGSGEPTTGGARVCPAAGAGHDPRDPPGSHAAALDAEPDDRPAWPVYLGSVRRQDGRIEVDGDGRVYAGQVGETVRSPSGRARMQVGAEAGGDRRRFAVATEVPAEGVGAPAVADRVSVDRSGDVRIHGAATVTSGMVVIPTSELVARRAPEGIRFRALPAEPAATPWALYRTEVDRSGVRVRLLRVEIATPEGDEDPGRYRFVLGAHDGGTFRPHLSVTADCTVTVHGDLDVRGTVAEGPVRADIADPRFVETLTRQWVQGAVASSRELSETLDGSLVVEVSSPASVEVGAELGYTVRVRSTGPATVGALAVHAVVAVDDAVEERVQLGLGKATSLAAGAEIEVGSTFTPESGRRITISVLAVGVTPGGTVVSDTGSASANIGSVIG